MEKRRIAASCWRGYGNGVAFGVAARVASRDGYDGNGVVGDDVYGDGIEPVVCASDHDLRQVTVGGEEGKKSLGLGVAATDIIFQNTWSMGRDHETGEEDADEREACIVNTMQRRTSGG